MNDKLNSIVLISIYFGNTSPWYLYYYFLSCKYNKKILYLFITNLNFSNLDYTIPKNVRILNFTLKEFENLASNILGFRIYINNSYKLCDFKPAYGLIFFKYIKNISFWGYADIDVIYGNILKFLTPTLLKNNDIITIHHEYLTGVFTIFRNTKFMRELFKNSHDYINIFKSDENFCFDELGGVPLHRYEDNDMSFYNELSKFKIESMTHVVRKFISENKLSAFFDTFMIEGCPGYMKWNRGTLIYKGKYEAMLYHLISFKDKCRVAPKFVNDRFRISKTRIYI